MSESIKYFALTCIVVVAILAFIQQMKNPPDKETAERWHKDPDNWKMGIFYYNPQDSRIFPPKRTKIMGWTVNFGNPISVAAFIVLLAALLYFASNNGL
jgi:uncharacterized membrane protein